MTTAMPETTIASRELLAAMSPGLPFKVAKNLALASLFASKGVRYERRSAFGFDEPKVLPPFEVWYDSSKDAWQIRQGAESTD